MNLIYKLVSFGQIDPFTKSPQYPMKMMIQTMNKNFELFFFYQTKIDKFVFQSSKKVLS